VGLRGEGLDATRETRLVDADRSGVCPTCDRQLGAHPTGTGSIADGRFCGLECLAKFYEPELRRKATEGARGNGDASG
jgi:hypothetical protein